MSNINNLYSLLGGKWMITDQFANSLTPYLLNILSKGEFPDAANNNPMSVGFFSQIGFFEEEVKEDQKYVAVLSIKGPILKYSQFCGPSGTRSMKTQMSEWENNDSVVGVLLDIDSGGGQVSGTGEFAEYIYNYSKPVVSYTDGMICSAAYYIASGSKEIIANKHSDCIGSIGTMIKYLDLDGAYKKLGVNIIEEYATKSTKKNNAFRLAKKGDLKALVKEELDPINEKFHNEVESMRIKVKKENLNGQHINDMQSCLDLGLIDFIGDKQFAIDRIFELSKESTTHKNESDMSAENQTFPALAGVLGQEEIKASKKILTGKTGVFLNISELQAIEGKLSGHNEVLAALQTKVDDGNTKMTSLEASETAINAAVENALKTADLEAGEDTQASIKLLGDKVAEYGAKPGAEGTTITSTGDRQEGEGAESTSIFDSIVK